MADELSTRIQELRRQANETAKGGTLPQSYRVMDTSPEGAMPHYADWEKQGEEGRRLQAGDVPMPAFSVLEDAQTGQTRKVYVGDELPEGSITAIGPQGVRVIPPVEGDEYWIPVGAGTRFRQRPAAPVKGEDEAEDAWLVNRTRMEAGWEQDFYDKHGVELEDDLDARNKMAQTYGFIPQMEIQKTEGNLIIYEVRKDMMSDEDAKEVPRTWVYDRSSGMSGPGEA